MKQGKRYVEAAKLVDKTKAYQASEAMELIEKMPKAKFDETVECRLGKVLGPKGLMPNPKSGTVTMDVTKAVSEIKSGKVEYRLDKTNIIHLGIGKVSFGAKKLTENYQTIIDAIIKAKPAAAKGQYIKSVTLTTTMGPSIAIDQK